MHVYKNKVKSLSHVQLFATPWPVAYQVLLSMGFSRQGHWSGWVVIYFSNVYIYSGPIFNEREIMQFNITVLGRL